MKKCLAMLYLSCTFLFISTSAVFAVEIENDNNLQGVTITVVMPDKTTSVEITKNDEIKSTPVSETVITTPALSDVPAFDVQSNITESNSADRTDNAIAITTEESDSVIAATAEETDSVIAVTVEDTNHIDMTTTEETAVIVPVTAASIKNSVEPVLTEVNSTVENNQIAESNQFVESVNDVTMRKKLYPSDVTETHDNSEWQIIKTYELNTDENPEDIPCDSFIRKDGTTGMNRVFTLTDIVRKEISNTETREHTETVALNTDSKELEKILPLLSPTMEYKTDDGFAGVLSLDVSSIKVETAGTKTSNYTMNISREYPHLSANDTSLIPKTVQDNGKTYTLANVDWLPGNTITVDYEVVPEYYTAVATYTAKGTSTKITGYNVSAVYTGTLAKLTEGKTVYTAYFIGEETAVLPKQSEPITESANNLGTKSKTIAAGESMNEDTTSPAVETANEDITSPAVDSVENSLEESVSEKNYSEKSLTELLLELLTKDNITTKEAVQPASKSENNIVIKMDYTTLVVIVCLIVIIGGAYVLIKKKRKD